MIKVNEILILKEAAEDLQEGRKFYNINGASVGNYFWDSLLSDLDSLAIFAGIHIKHKGLYRMLSKRFPYAIYYQIKKAFLHKCISYAKYLPTLLIEVERVNNSLWLFVTIQ